MKTFAVQNLLNTKVKKFKACQNIRQKAMFSQRHKHGEIIDLVNNV